MGSRMVQRGGGVSEAGGEERAREQLRDFVRGFCFWYYEVRLVNNFGMIAKSGTKASLVAMVLAALSSSGSAFSAYLVSDKVRVVSKSF